VQAGAMMLIKNYAHK